MNIVQKSDVELVYLKDIPTGSLFVHRLEKKRYRIKGDDNAGFFCLTEYIYKHSALLDDKVYILIDHTLTINE